MGDLVGLIKSAAGLCSPVLGMTACNAHTTTSYM